MASIPTNSVDRKNLVGLILVLWLCRATPQVVSASRHTGQSRLEATSLVPQSGTFGPLQTLGLWQLPPDEPPKKSLVIIKGANISPYAFWDYSPSCRECTGLPEKRKFVADAIARGYAVFIPQSNEDNLPWISWPEDNPDMLNLYTVISEWKSLLGFESLPMVALGFSAGVNTLSTLGLRPGLFQSMCWMVGEGQPQAWEAATHEYPPTIFVYMPKDINRSANIANARKTLESKRIPTKEELWYEHPLTPEWYSESIGFVTPALAAAIIDAFREDGFLTESNFLISDDYMSDWEARFTGWNLLPWQDSLLELVLANQVQDESRLAFARHTMIARNDEVVFAWFEGDHSDHSGNNPAEGKAVA